LHASDLRREEDAAVARTLQRHRQSSEWYLKQFVVGDLAGLLDGSSMTSRHASHFSFGTPKWLRTKNCSLEVMKLFSVENGNSRFSGFRSRTIRPAKACAWELWMDSWLDSIVLIALWLSFLSNAKSVKNKVARKTVPWRSAAVPPPRGRDLDRGDTVDKGFAAFSAFGLLHFFGNLLWESL
jgi:hypothetical protein